MISAHPGYSVSRYSQSPCSLQPTLVTRPVATANPRVPYSAPWLLSQSLQSVAVFLTADHRYSASRYSQSPCSLQPPLAIQSVATVSRRVPYSRPSLLGQSLQPVPVFLTADPRYSVSRYSQSPCSIQPTLATRVSPVTAAACGSTVPPATACTSRWASGAGTTPTRASRRRRGTRNATATGRSTT